LEGRLIPDELVLEDVKLKIIEKRDFLRSPYADNRV
jgi:hypothetical protein